MDDICIDAGGREVESVSVKVKFTGAAPAVSSFSDLFNRANGTIGDNYITAQSITASSFSVSGNQFVFTNTGTSGQDYCACIRVPGLVGAPSQFVQMTWRAFTGAPRSGPAVYMSGRPENGVGVSNMQGYFLMYAPDVPTCHVFGVKDGNPNYQIGAGSLNICVPAVADVMGLQVDIGTASNRVRVWQNGNLVFDGADTDADRPNAFGLPFFLSAGTGQTTTWDDLVIRQAR